MSLIFVPQITTLETSHDSYYLEKIIELPSSSIPQFDLIMLRTDMNYFQENKDKLMKDPNLQGKYVAIHNGKILGADKDNIELTKKMYSEYGYIPILIQRLGLETIYTVYSPHLQ